jgi:hypothetical protein
MTLEGVLIMSSLAVTCFGDDPRSVWDFRTEFLSDGIKHEEHFCPFCGIRLTPILVYSNDEELSKTPNFSARHGAHLHGCDGEVEHPSPARGKSEEAKSHYVKSVMTYPQMLIGRKSPTGSAKKRKPVSKIGELTEGTIQSARRDAYNLGVARPRTYLLQPIVEARSIAFDEVYKKYPFDENESKEAKDSRYAFKKSLLSSMPINIGGFDTNYLKAFTWLDKYFSIYPRIYFKQSRCFTVTVNEALLLVCFSNVKISISFDKHLESHRKAVDKIVKLNDLNELIYWFAYGVATKTDDIVDLVVKSVDYLYIPYVMKSKK